MHWPTKILVVLELLAVALLCLYGFVNEAVLSLFALLWKVLVIESLTAQNHPWAAGVAFVIFVLPYVGICCARSGIVTVNGTEKPSQNATPADALLRWGRA